MPWTLITDTDPYWSHTKKDAVEEMARFNSTIGYKYVARRVNTSGNIGLVIQAIWIAVYTRREWGIQFRHNLGVPTQR